LTALSASAAPSASATRRARLHRHAWPQRPFVETPELDAHMARHDASQEARSFAHELAETGLARLDLGETGRALCDAVVADTDPVFADGDVYRIQDAWLRYDSVRRLATLPGVTDLLSMVYGRPAFPFQTLNFKRGSQQGLHSDAMHFHAEPPLFMCGVWIALEDVAPDAGPLTYVPGSHKLPVLTMRAAGCDKARPTSADYETVYGPALAARLKASGLPQAQILPKKGEAVVWAANLAHGGAPIANPDATRRSLVVHFYFADCLYYTPVHSDVEGGRLAVRLPTNVATGGWAWPSREGRPAAPQVTAFLGACRKLVTRQPLITRISARTTS
jgi:hypothetical protein